MWPILRDAVRRLGRAPLSSLSIILAVGGSVGLLLAAGAISRAFWFDYPEGVRDPHELARLRFRAVVDSAVPHQYYGTSYPTLRSLQRASIPGTRLAGYAKVDLHLRHKTRIVEVRGLLTTGSYFDVLGVDPSIGRFYSSSDASNAPSEFQLVLSDRLWRSEFGADTNVIGMGVGIGDHVYTVVGIAPPRFHGLEPVRVDLWVPLGQVAQSTVAFDWQTNAGSRWLNAIARISRDRDRSAVEAQFNALSSHVTRNLGQGAYDSVFLDDLRLVNHLLYTTEVRVAGWITLLATLVTLLAVANASSLILLRIVRRLREFGVMLALGATVRRIQVQLLSEVLVLAVLAVAFAIALYTLSVWKLLPALMPDHPLRLASVPLRFVLYSAAGLGLLTLLIGLVPVRVFGRLDVSRLLTTSPIIIPALPRRQLQVGIVALQVSLTTILLIGAVALVTSFNSMMTRDLGYDRNRLLIGTMDLDSQGMPSDEIERTFLLMRDRIQLLPGIQTVSVAITAPFTTGAGVWFFVDGGKGIPRIASGSPYLNAVDPHFFRATGMRIVAGRAFDSDDREGSERVALISASTGRLIWRGESPIGSCIRFSSPSAPCTRIVGIVQDSHRRAILEDTTMLLFVPLAQNPFDYSFRSLFVRTVGDAAGMVSTVAREMQAVQSGLPPARVNVVSELVEPEIRPWRMGALLMSVVATLGLVIAILGLWSVAAANAAERYSELALRAAVGASSYAIVWAVIKESLVFLFAGVCVGALMGNALLAVMSSVLRDTAAPTLVIVGTSSISVVIVGLFVVGPIALYAARRVGRAGSSQLLRA